MFSLPSIIQNLPPETQAQLENSITRYLHYTPWLKGRTSDSEAQPALEEYFRRVQQTEGSILAREVVWVTDMGEVERLLATTTLVKERKQERERWWKNLLAFAKEQGREEILQEVHFAIRQEVLRQGEGFAVVEACSWAAEELALGLGEQVLYDVGWVPGPAATLAQLWQLGFWPLGSLESQFFVYALPVKPEQQTRMLGSTGRGLSLIDLSVDSPAKTEDTPVLDPTIQMERLEVTDKDKATAAASSKEKENTTSSSEPVSSETVPFAIEQDPHQVSPSAEVSILELGELQGTLLDDSDKDESDAGATTQEAGSSASLVASTPEETAHTREVSPRRRKEEKKPLPRLEKMESVEELPEIPSPQTQELSLTAPKEPETKKKEKKSKSASAVQQNITLGMAPGGLTDDLMSELFGEEKLSDGSQDSLPELTSAPAPAANPGATAMYIPAAGNVEIGTTSPKQDLPELSIASSAPANPGATAMYMPAVTDIKAEGSTQETTPRKSSAPKQASAAKISLGSSAQSSSPRGTAMYIQAVTPEMEAGMKSQQAPQAQPAQPVVTASAPQSHGATASPGSTAMYIPAAGGVEEDFEAVEGPPTQQFDQPRFPRRKQAASPAATAMYTPAAANVPQDATIQTGPVPIAMQPAPQQQPMPQQMSPQPPVPQPQPGYAQQPMGQPPLGIQQNWPHQPQTLSQVVAAPTPTVSPYHQPGTPSQQLITGTTGAPHSISHLDDDFDLEGSAALMRNKKNKTMTMVLLVIVLFALGGGVFWYIKANSASALFASAQSASKANDCKKALGLLTQVLQKEQKFPGAHRLQGQCQLKSKQPIKAMESLQTAIKLAPKDTESLLALGQLLEQRGKWLESRAIYQKLSVLMPKNADIWNAYGRLLTALGQLQQARSVLGKAIRLNGQKSGFWVNLGAALLKQAQKDPKNTDTPALIRQAAANFRKALTLSPQSAQALRNLGDSLLYQARLEKNRKERKALLEKAEKYYKQARLQDASDAALNHQMGMLRILQYQYQSAVPLLNRALEEYNSSTYAEHPQKDQLRSSTLYNLSVALEGAGNIDKAITQMRAYLKLQSDNADGHCRLGQLLRIKRDSAGAKAAYAQCLRLDPTDKDAKRWGR